MGGGISFEGREFDYLRADESGAGRPAAGGWDAGAQPRRYAGGGLLGSRRRLGADGSGIGALAAGRASPASLKVGGVTWNVLGSRFKGAV